MARRQTLLVLLLLIFACETRAQSGRLIKAPPPEPASIAGFHKGHCVALPHRVRLCKMLSDNDDTFIVEKEGKRIGSWAGGTYLGETSDFEVLHGDLDGDKRSELIVANLDSTSAGMGVSYWTIAIFPDPEFRDYQAPLTFSVQEYGSFGTFVTAGAKWISSRPGGSGPTIRKEEEVKESISLASGGGTSPANSCRC